jgi:hypothetical protein
MMQRSVGLRCMRLQACIRFRVQVHFLSADENSAADYRWAQSSMAVGCFEMRQSVGSYVDRNQ